MRRMKEDYPRLSIESLCALFGKSRNAYYKGQRQKIKRANEQEMILLLVKSYRKEMPRIGGASCIIF